MYVVENCHTLPRCVFPCSATLFLVGLIGKIGWRRFRFSTLRVDFRQIPLSFTSLCVVAMSARAAERC